MEGRVWKSVHDFEIKGHPRLIALLFMLLFIDKFSWFGFNRVALSESTTIPNEKIFHFKWFGQREAVFLLWPRE